MKKLLLPIVLFFSSSVYGETAFEVFAEQVHPILQNRCAECHGTVQAPMHAVVDTESAYNVARKTVNIHFPKNSSLWVRSYNNHCGEVGACGFIDDQLYQGIEEWLEREKDEIVVDGFDKIADGLLLVPDLKKDDQGKVIKTEKKFSFQASTGETFQLSVSRLSESVIYISEGKIGRVKNYTSFEGFELRSSDIQIRTQNFSDYPLVLKPTEDGVDFTSGQGGYLMAILPDVDMRQASVELFVRGRKANLDRDEAKSLFENGYALPREQSKLGPEIKKIHAGHFFNCAIFTSGRIKCWGANFYGQLGLGNQLIYGDQANEMGYSLPYVDLGQGEKVKQLASTEYTNCALLESNKVKCWGEGEDGLLGYGDGETVGNLAGQMGDNLVPVDFGTEEEILKIEGGLYHYCVLFVSGRMKCWGLNSLGPLGLEDRVLRGLNGTMGEKLPYVNLGTNAKAKDIALGDFGTCALLQEGSVKCWGENHRGQLGQGNTSSIIGRKENTMGDNLKPIDFGDDAGPVKSIVGGSKHYCALFESGKVKCWGAGDYAQLGLGNTYDYGVTRSTMGDGLPYVDLGQEKVKEIGAGTVHSCAFFESGKVKCWGQGFYGQLGTGEDYTGDFPSEMGEALSAVDLGEAKILDFSTNSYSSCAVLESRKAKCWGWNGNGELGIGDTMTRGDQLGEMGVELPYVDFGQEWRFD